LGDSTADDTADDAADDDDGGSETLKRKAQKEQ